jgi:hypothetical protein
VDPCVDRERCTAHPGAPGTNLRAAGTGGGRVGPQRGAGWPRGRGSTDSPAPSSQLRAAAGRVLRQPVKIQIPTPRGHHTAQRTPLCLGPTLNLDSLGQVLCTLSWGSGGMGPTLATLSTSLPAAVQYREGRPHPGCWSAAAHSRKPEICQPEPMSCSPHTGMRVDSVSGPGWGPQQRSLPKNVTAHSQARALY